MTTKKFNSATWANIPKGIDISPKTGRLPIQMHNSDGTALPLLEYEGFGADIIRFEGGKGVATHTHKGDHFLFVLKGEGFVEYYGVDYPLSPGLVYLVPGSVPHAIKATTELVLIAIGNEHRQADSEDRLDMV